MIPKSKKLKIKKPFYKRWWFVTLIIFAVIGALGGEEEEQKKVEGLGVVAETPTGTDEENKPEEVIDDEPAKEEQVQDESSEEEVAENTNDIEETPKTTDVILPEPVNTNSTKDLKAHYIDVGQGDSIFIELPNGQSMLIDAGESNNGNQIVSYVKALGYNQIDYVVATHPHADHIGGMTTVINSLEIGKFYMPEKEHTTKTFESMIDALASNNVDVYRAKSGVEVINIDGLYAKFLSPVSSYGSDLNNWSAVIKVVYKNNSFLFMGDAENKVEGQLSDVNVDVLKVGHHGSETSSGLSFLKKVSPLHSIISVGTGNSYGHPTQSALSNLESLGSKVYRTDLLGTIIVTSDGNSITVNKNSGEALAAAPTPAPVSAPEQAPTPKPEPVTAPQPTPALVPEPTPAAAPQQPAISNIVYVADSGTKYHRSSCSYLNKSKNEISLEDAISRGYTPCSRCKP